MTLKKLSGVFLYGTIPDMNEIGNQFLRECEAYRDKHGLIHPSGPGGTNNGILYTAYCLAVFNKLQDGFVYHAQLPELRRFEQIFLSCEVHDRPGLFQRAPDNFWQHQGPDDYVGLGLAAAVLRSHGFPQLGERVRDYGRDHYWVFNNVAPCDFRLKSWLGRQRQLVAHLKWSAGNEPCLLDRVIWKVTVSASKRAERGNQDAFMLSWSLLEARRVLGHDVKAETKAFYDALFSKFSRGMGQVFSEYSGNAAHPLSKYWL